MNDIPNSGSDLNAGFDAVDAQGAQRVSCADEPIRVPGSIQPHGLLLGVNADNRTISFASANAQLFLDSPDTSLIGTALDLVLPNGLMAAIGRFDQANHPRNLVSCLGSFQLETELCSVLMHHVSGTRILEFERQNEAVSAETINAVMANFVATLVKRVRKNR